MMLLFLLLVSLSFAAFNFSLVPVQTFDEPLVDVVPVKDGFYALSPSQLYLYQRGQVVETIPIIGRQPTDMAVFDKYVVYSTGMDIFSILPGINSLNLSLYGVEAFEGTDHSLYACMSYDSINRYRWYKDEYGDFHYEFTGSLPLEFNCSDLAFRRYVYVAGEKTVVADSDLHPLVVCNISSKTIWPFNETAFFITNDSGLYLLDWNCTSLGYSNFSGKIRYPYLLSGRVVYRMNVTFQAEKPVVNVTPRNESVNPVPKNKTVEKNLTEEKPEGERSSPSQPICTLPLLLSAIVIAWKE
jgi:hypothetical protein